MEKWKNKLLKKIESKGKMLFLGKADLDTIGLLSEQNQMTALFNKLNEKNLVENSIQKENLKVLFVKDFSEIKEEFDSAVVFHEDFMGTKETNDFLRTAGKKIKKQGKIYFICKTSRGAKNFSKNMKEIFGNTETISVKNGVRLIKAVKEKKIKETKKETASFEFLFRNKKYFFQTSFGVFSKKKIDTGTKMLLENLSEVKEKKILDFGCGTGIIGIVLAKENPKARVVLLDSNAKAVLLAEKNIEKNKIKNAQAVVSDGLENAKEKFDLIASNPPTHEKRSFLENFIYKAKKALKKNGRLVIVLNKAVFLEKEMQEFFGNCKVYAEGKEHKVLEAVKK